MQATSLRNYFSKTQAVSAGTDATLISPGGTKVVVVTGLKIQRGSYTGTLKILAGTDAKMEIDMSNLETYQDRWAGMGGDMVLACGSGEALKVTGTGGAGSCRVYVCGYVSSDAFAAEWT